MVDVNEIPRLQYVSANICTLITLNLHIQYNIVMEMDISIKITDVLKQLHLKSGRQQLVFRG